MTGARQLAYVHEPPGNYRGSPTDTAYKGFGYNPTLDDLSFERAITRLGLPSGPETVDTLAQRFEGAFGISFVPSGDPWYLDHFFGTEPTGGGSSAPYTFGWTPELGGLNSARVFAGVDHLNGTAERELEGVVFGNLSIDFAEGEDVRFSATGFYADEQLNTSLTPGSVAQPSGTPLAFHGFQLDIDGSTQAKVQSATLDLVNNARGIRGADPHPLDAVTGSFETTLDVDKIYTGTGQTEFAYGGGTTTSDRVPGATGQIQFTTPNSTSLFANLSGVTPDSYAWQDLLDRDADLTENISYVVESVSVEAQTAIARPAGNP
jgi:hypothetical protein